MTSASRSRDLTGLVAIFLLVVAASLPGLVRRSIWHDEAITLLETSSGPTPRPEEPVAAAELKPAFEGRPSMAAVLEVVREVDIHPPVYYWVLSWWKSLFGPSVLAARALSLVATLGSVVVFYLLLQSAGRPSPLPAVLIFSAATFTVHLSHEARNYALGTFLLLTATLLAWRAIEEEPGPPSRAAFARAAAGGAAAGSAFLTSYLSVFWIVALVAWFALSAWRKGRALAALLPFTAAGVGLGGFLLMGLSRQLSNPGSRQDVGFDGFAGEMRGILLSLVDLLVNQEGYWGKRAVALVLTALVGWAIWRLGRGGLRAGRWHPRLVVFFVAVGALSVAGIALLDLTQDKHLYRATRYLYYSVPAMAVLLTCGVAAWRSRALRVGGGVLVLALAALQLGTVNWSDERCRGGTRSGRPHRSVAAAIAASPRQPVLALIGVGHGRGDPWSYVYEMDPSTPVVFIHWSTDPETLVGIASAYEEVWLLQSFEGTTERMERMVWDALLESGHFRDDPPGLDRRVLRAVRKRGLAPFS